MNDHTPGSIDEYIAAFPPDVQTALRQIRAVIRETAPDSIEAMKYRIPTFVLGGNLVHFAAFANHIGFYPTPSGIAAFRKELAEFEGGKGSVQFPISQPMPLELIRRIVRYRVEEVQRQTKKRKKGK